MKRIISIILSISIIISSFAFALADGVDGPLQKEKIKVGVSADYQPFEYYDESGKLTGFSIDLMNYIGDRSGYDIEYVNIPFEEILTSVINGDVDCAISTISVTQERKQYVDYTREYLKTNNITVINGQKSVKFGESYAVVFKKGLGEAPYKETPLTEEEALYVKVNQAISDLSQDRTVTKLIEKYELNKSITDDGEYVEYSAVISGGDPGAMTSATSNPASDWAKSDIQKASALNIINYGGNYNFTSAVTREEFCEFIYNYCANVVGHLKIHTGDNKFTDTDNPHILSLYSMGIIEGKSQTTFAPKEHLTREEAAAILFRLIDKIHPDWESTELYFEFEDSADISSWAMSPIQRICNMGIMKGVADNIFSPKEIFTTEQAIATIIRVFAGFYNQGSTSKWDSLTFADKLNANMPVDKNYMFSPLSIKIALMMAANGATGETLSEILKVTDVEDLQKFNQSTRTMLDKYSESEILKLNVSNSIWINSDKTAQRFSKEFEDVLSKFFDATSDVVNDKNAVDEINGWVNEKTQGKIPSIITDNNKDFWAMLINAVYFKGRWQKEFSKSATKKDIFTSRDGLKKEIDFMNRRGWISYCEKDGVSVVSLPYLTRQDVFDEKGQYVETKKLEGVNISMYLMMSDGSFSPEDVLNNTEMKSTYMNLSLPKFQVEYTTSLNDMLKTIGINKAFDESAEFEKMFDHGNMWIDSTLHKTFIKVDEEGTEASAITSVGMAGSSLPPEPIDVKFNKPFTFVIKDDVNGEILFMGEYAFAE